MVAWAAWIPSIVSGAASLLGSSSSRSASNAANRTQQDLSAQNIALQREFAKKGIQWRVADAKAAGIHPLYALGANTNSFSPVSQISYEVGSGLGAAGQAIDAAFATRNLTQQQRLQAKAQSLQLYNQTKVADSEVRLNNAMAAEALTAARAATAAATTRRQSPELELRDAMQELSRTDDPRTRTIETVQENPVEVSVAGIRTALKGGQTPASFWQERYGEPGEWVFGVLNMLQDLGHSFYGGLQSLTHARDSGLTPAQIRRQVESEAIRRGTPGSYLRYKD